jgi:RNA polymerase sigma factor (sigma-70 family)
LAPNFCNFLKSGEFLKYILQEIITGHLDDMAIMSRVIDGEIDKMGILYERYKMPVYSYFFRVTCGDREASEDLVHTVFYRAIRYRHTFTGDGSFAKWIFRIARNSALDYNRKIKNTFNHESDTWSGQHVIDEDDDSGRREKIEQLYFAMKKLEPEEREIIILGKIECLKYREIADILGTTEGSVKIRIFRAMRKLKDILLKIEKYQI